MSDRSPWRATSGWAGLVPPDPSGATGLQIELIESVSLATIIVRAGQEAELARLVGPHFGCDLPGAGRVSFGRTGDLVWSAPGQWLIVAKSTEALADLPARLAAVAAVTDQGDSRALVRVSGPRSREALAKGVAIDLHPSAFSTGSAAVTKVAHLSVQIWQLDEAPAYMIAVPRSFAGSFWSWLSAACAPTAMVKS